MTRLTEALERARANSASGIPRLVPRAGEGGAPTAHVPSAWDFTEEAAAPAIEHRAPVELPSSWNIEHDRGATTELPPPAAADSPAAAPAPPRVAEKRPAALDLKQLDPGLEHPERKFDCGKLVVGGSAIPSVVEQYRSLAAALHHAQMQTGARVIMVSSAVEGEGKTLTSANLALTLSHSYQRRVLLIDADLRRPTVHDLFHLDNREGLGDTLRQALPGGTLPVQQVLPTLWVITAGHPDPDPLGGLVSDTMKLFLADAVEQFDWVVIDTPPVGLLPDAGLLAAMVDTAVLVVSAGTTPYPLVTRAIDAIGRSRILGVVLNRSKQNIALGYDSYSYGPGR